MIVSLAVAITTQLLLPFPWGLLTAISIFVIFPLAYRKYVFKGGSIFSIGKQGGVRWVCLTCGKQGKDSPCKRCGGKQFKTS